MIYFAQFRCGIVKIGSSSRPGGRVRDFGWQYPELGQAELLGVMGPFVRRGDQAEHWIQRIWQHLWVDRYIRHGKGGCELPCEFFHHDPLLLEWIGVVLGASRVTA